MRERRRALTPEARRAASAALSKRLFVTDLDLGKAISKKGPIAVYLASKEEIDLTDFISAALSFGCVLVAPRWNGTEYELVRIENLEMLVKGPHGILEPSAGPVVRPRDVRAWLVPGLAFTRKADVSVMAAGGMIDFSARFRSASRKSASRTPSNLWTSSRRSRTTFALRPL